MIDSNEVPSGPKLEIFKLGQRFPLFPPDPGRTQTDFNDREQADFYNRSNFIEIPGLPNLPLEITAEFFDETSKKDGITPFDPHIGYWITGQDKVLDERVKKLRSMGIEADRKIDLSLAPLILMAGTMGTKLNLLGLVTKVVDEGDSVYELKEDAKEIFSKLRLQVFFPKGSYEAKPSSFFLRDGNLNFSNFYPLDFGELAKDAELVHMSEFNSSIKEGLNIFLPSDPEKLAQIEGSITLVTNNH